AETVEEAAEAAEETAEEVTKEAAETVDEAADAAEETAEEVTEEAAEAAEETAEEVTEAAQETAEAVEEAAAAVYPELKAGVEEPEAVKALQERLKELNWYQGEADGIYSEETQKAVEAFAAAAGAASDGTATEDLQKLLYDGNAPSNTAQAETEEADAVQTASAAFSLFPRALAEEEKANGPAVTDSRVLYIPEGNLIIGLDLHNESFRPDGVVLTGFIYADAATLNSVEIEQITLQPFDMPTSINDLSKAFSSVGKAKDPVVVELPAIDELGSKLETGIVRVPRSAVSACGAALLEAHGDIEPDSQRAGFVIVVEGQKLKAGKYTADVFLTIDGERVQTCGMVINVSKKGNRIKTSQVQKTIEEWADKA
ncbi:MAG: peptidoglycan-binding protein, partial [Clostridia bacterium]|nr:peptidoglycan-binding protein [Clostridia bacterium]